MRPATRARYSAAATSGCYGTALSLALVTPLILPLGLAFLYPVGRLLWGSVFTPAATGEHYARIIDQGLYLKVFLRTFEIAFIVAAATFLLGYPVALGDVAAQGLGGRVDHGLRPYSPMDQRARAFLCLDRAAATHRRHQYGAR